MWLNKLEHSQQSPLGSLLNILLIKFDIKAVELLLHQAKCLKIIVFCKKILHQRLAK